MQSNERTDRPSATLTLSFPSSYGMDNVRALKRYIDRHIQACAFAARDSGGKQHWPPGLYEYKKGSDLVDIRSQITEGSILDTLTLYAPQILSDQDARSFLVSVLANFFASFVGHLGSTGSIEAPPSFSPVPTNSLERSAAQFLKAMRTKGAHHSGRFEAYYKEGDREFRLKMEIGESDKPSEPHENQPRQLL